jgi:hypothetical protein
MFLLIYIYECKISNFSKKFKNRTNYVRKHLAVPDVG